MEIPDDAKPELLAAYIDRWYWQVKGHVGGLTPRSTTEQRRAVAASIPVFELVGLGKCGRCGGGVRRRGRDGVLAGLLAGDLPGHRGGQDAPGAVEHADEHGAAVRRR